MMQNWSKQRDEPVDVGIAVRVNALALEKFWRWVDLAKGEVSALGLVEETRDPKSGRVAALTITDIFLVMQHSDDGETEMTSVGVSALILKLVSEGIDPGKLRFWIHSHGTMDVFWSSTDNECIKGLCNEEWMLSLVVNKRRDSMMRLDQYHPAHFYMSSIRWRVFLDLPQELEEKLDLEFTLKVYEGVWSPASSILPANSLNPRLVYESEELQLSDDELDDAAYWESLEQEGLKEMAQEESGLEVTDIRRNNGR